MRAKGLVCRLELLRDRKEIIITGRWVKTLAIEFTMIKRTLLHTSAALLVVGLVAGCAMNRQEGRWQAFFEKNTAGWRGYRQTGFPAKGWVLENGGLHLLPKSGGGDIVTIKKYTDFEFEWDWRMGPKGNNGIKYLVTEDRPGVPGPEYQMVDDSTIPEAHHQTAAFYWVFPPRADKPLHPPGQWNHSRLVVRGNHVEHWLNGMKVLAYELGSPEVKTAVAVSKFKNAPGYGEKIPGHIMITDHTEETWFRNVRIRELPSK